MEYPDFSFYNSENDGYRGGFGDYTDPIPTSGGPDEPGCRADRNTVWTE